MARYIDADKMQVNCLKDKKFVFAMENPYTQEVIMEIVYKDFLDFLNEQPTADVVEVVHGEWIEGFGSWATMNCSKCDWKVPYFSSIGDIVSEQKLYDSLHYCPNCGAKMDGKKVE